MRTGKDRGRFVGLVFSTQALGLIIGPLIALACLGAGTGHVSAEYAVRVTTPLRAEAGSDPAAVAS